MEKDNSSTASEEKSQTEEVSVSGPPDPAVLAQAEEFKEKGNAFFKIGKLNEAHEMYSEAILLGLKGKQGAIYYSNRAFANIKLENYGIAIHDANKALELDPTFIKAYYRRGSAYLALNHLDDAVKDFHRVCKLAPNDKDARQKYDTAKKEKMLRAFSDSIKVEEKSLEINVEDIVVPESYTGPRFDSVDDIDVKWCEQLMEHMREQKLLHKKYLVQIIMKVRDEYAKEDSLVDIEVPGDEEITVCGDVHG